MILQMNNLNYNPGQDIWNKMEKLSKNWTGKEKLGICFSVLLSAIAEV